MPTIRAEEVRIPRRAREAVARHEEVVVTSRERAAFMIVNPDDHRAASIPAPRGRPLRDALAALIDAAAPDPEFANDMEDVLRSAGPGPADPLARS